MSKRLFQILGPLLCIVLYQNCAPSFQSSSTFFEASEIGGAPIDPDTLNSKPTDKPYISNQFNRYMSDEARAKGQFSLSCNNANSELIENQPSNLTGYEIENTIKEILDVNSDATMTSTEYDNVNGFEEGNIFSANESTFTEVSLIADIAAQNFILSLENKKNKHYNCDFTQKCLDNLKEMLPKYLWRRPLTSKEKSLITNVSNAGVQGEHIKSKIYRLVSFLIQSPQFYIHNLTLKSSSNISEINIYEYASRMAFFLSSAGPSKNLLDQMFSGKISNRSDVQKFAGYMLNVEAVQQKLVEKFFGRWFAFGESMNDETNFNGKKVSDISKQSLDKFIELFKQNAPLSEIINSQNVKDSFLASPYFSYITHADKDYSSFVKKGVQILTNINCFKLPELGEATEEEIGDVLSSPDFPVDGTIIEKQEFHRKDSKCSSCHNFIDPSSAGLIWLDDFGQPKSSYPDGKPIVLSSQLGNKEYNSLDGYLSILSKTADFEACFAEKVHKKFMPTPWLKQKQDIKPCMINQLFGQANTNQGIKTLFLESLKTNAFINIRKPNY